MSVEKSILIVNIDEIREVLQKFYLHIATQSKSSEDFHQYVAVSGMNEDELIQDFKAQKIPERICAQTLFWEIQCYTKDENYRRVIANFGSDHCGDCIPYICDTPPEKLEERTGKLLTIEKLKGHLYKLEGSQAKRPKLTVICDK